LNNVVDMNGLPLDAEQRHAFVVDLARFADGTLTEQQVRRTWHLFTDEIWQALGQNEPLIEEIESVKLERIRSGATKRERAQLLVTEAPEIAADIMRDPGANARHRLDACKVLDDFSATGRPAAVAAAGEFFQITINLGSDLDGKPVIETYNKSIAVNPNDPNDTTRFDKAVTIDVNDGDAKPAQQRRTPKVIEPGDDYGG
jgi:hypothetical protein